MNVQALHSRMSVDEAIVTRRSVRAFKPDPVPLETVRHVLNVAARAPSGTNIQPWNVYVLTGAAREKVTDAVLKRREAGPADPEIAYYPKKWREPYIGRRRKVGFDLYAILGIGKADKAAMWSYFARNYRFFGAPVGLFFTLDRDLELGSYMDLGMFLQNVMIAARGQGLDTCPQAAWVEYPKTVAQAVGIPDTEILACGMSLGYEDKSDKINTLTTEREPCEKFAKFVGF
ncbi:MAG: nitroreductase [Alphaproteobacteria bacterium]